MSDQPAKLPDVSEWLVQLIRLTAFPHSPDSLNLESWWKDLIGEEPATSTVKKFERVQSGRWNDAVLKLNADPFRIQWVPSIRVEP